MAGIAITRMELTATELRAAAGKTKDPEAQEAFKKTSPKRVLRRSRRGRGTSRLKSASKSDPGQKTVRGTVFPANARVGQQGTLTRIWARRGTRPHAPRDTRSQWALARSLELVAFSGSLFGAVCPARAVATGLVLPFVNTAAMNAHLAEIARSVAPESHAVLILDGAGWHGSNALVIPDNLFLLTLPPYSPEPCVAKNSPPDCFLNAPHQSRTSGNISAQLARDQRLRQLRRYRRRLLHRMEALRQRYQNRNPDHRQAVGTGHMKKPLV